MILLLSSSFASQWANTFSIYSCLIDASISCEIDTVRFRSIISSNHKLKIFVNEEFAKTIVILDKPINAYENYDKHLLPMQNLPSLVVRYRNGFQVKKLIFTENWMEATTIVCSIHFSFICNQRQCVIQT